MADKIFVKKILLSILFNLVVLYAFNQYKLSADQIKNGYAYLIDNASFKNPNSVVLNDVYRSKVKFKKECFTFNYFDVSAQNGFGGFVRSSFLVFYFEGKPFYCCDSEDLKNLGMNFNTKPDETADFIIGLGVKKMFGANLENSHCPGELEKLQRDKEIENDIKTKQDKELFKAIDELIVQSKLKEALILWDKLNFTNRELSDRINQKIQIVSTKISGLLEKEQLDSAIYFYNLIPDSQELRRAITNKLSSISSFETKFNVSDDFVDFLKLKNDIFNGIFTSNKKCNYKLFVDYMGNGLFKDSTGKEITSINIPERFIPKKNYKGFEFLVNSEANVNFLLDWDNSRIKGVILPSWMLGRQNNQQAIKEDFQKGYFVVYYAEKRGKKYIYSNSSQQFNPIPPKGNFEVLNKIDFKEIEFNGQEFKCVRFIPVYLNGKFLFDRKQVLNEEIKYKEYAGTNWY